MLYINSGAEFFSVSVYNDQVTVAWKFDVMPLGQVYRFRKDEPDGNWTTVLIRMDNNGIMGKFSFASEDTTQSFSASVFPLESWQKLVTSSKIILGGRTGVQDNIGEWGMILKVKCQNNLAHSFRLKKMSMNHDMKWLTLLLSDKFTTFNCRIAKHAVSPYIHIICKTFYENTFRNFLLKCFCENTVLLKQKYSSLKKTITGALKAELLSAFIKHCLQNACTLCRV